MKNLKLKTSFNIYKLLALVLVTVTTSCNKDFLDKPTQGAYTEGNYPYLSGAGPFDDVIFSCYDGLRAYGVHAVAFVSATNVRSEDADKGSTAADGPNVRQFDDFTMTSANGQINGMWTSHYDIIQDCNLALKKIELDDSPLTDPAAKLSAEAEARFIRAYAYFMMVRYFGNIPLILSIPENGETPNVPQSPPADVYAAIEDDLRFAGVNLPPTWPKEYIGRATSGAANGLLAKVYLTRNKWAEAKAAAEKVIYSGNYDLLTPYEKIFGESGENSSESVFEVQATKVQGIANGTYGVQYAADQGLRGGGGSPWNFGLGFNVPSEQLEAAYEAGDPRKARTILYSGGTTVYGEQLPSSFPNPRYNHKVLSNPAYRAKYLDNFGWWMNVRILRYADVVLMYAEAANEIGGEANIDSAKKYLNKVRERARNGQAGILPDITSDDQGEVRQAIRHERRIELAMEHERFFDLVRWGIAEQVLHAAGKTNFVKGRDELIPIPQTQLDISGGVLKPNPGFN